MHTSKRWPRRRLTTNRLGGWLGVAYRQELAMRLTQETLGKVRAVAFGVVFALVLIAYAVHRLHL